MHAVNTVVVICNGCVSKVYDSGKRWRGAGCKRGKCPMFKCNRKNGWWDV